MIKLDPSKRILFLTKDLSLIKQQLYQGLNLLMSEMKPSDLLDDINTDIMTPAWVCFHHEPTKIAEHAYAGLMLDNERVFVDGALKQGGFQAIVSGERKGTGSSRETAAQCEKFAGINLIFAASFAPIHQRNNINLGQIMGSYELLRRLQKGEEIGLEEFLEPFDTYAQAIIRAGGLFNFLKTPLIEDKTNNPHWPMNIAQKIISKKLTSKDSRALKLGHSLVAQVDGGYSHEFTTAQVHQFLLTEYGDNYIINNPQKFAAFEDHLIYADYVKKFTVFLPLINELRKQQRYFIKHSGVRDYSAIDGISPGICHEVAREDFIMPGDLIEATDSHTCMGGALNAFAFGVGATEYAALLATGLSVMEVPATLRFDLVGQLSPSCSAKDIILYILLKFSKPGLTLNKILEFGGPALANISIDERATLCNMATECGAKTGICEPDDRLIAWLIKRRPGLSENYLRGLVSMPDPDCYYQARYSIDLSLIEPMVALPSDPTNGELIRNLGEISIDIAYGGSCTAGKYDDIDMYARVVKSALKQGQKLSPGVQFFIQYGSKNVADYARTKGHHQAFLQAGINIIPPGCGACIGCGPGVSTDSQQVTISAINRNFQGRSGPGQLYLGSPLSVAASAFAGKIVAWTT